MWLFNSSTLQSSIFFKPKQFDRVEFRSLMRRIVAGYQSDEYAHQQPDKHPKPGHYKTLYIHEAGHEVSDKDAEDYPCQATQQAHDNGFDDKLLTDTKRRCAEGFSHTYF